MEHKLAKSDEDVNAAYLPSSSPSLSKQSINVKQFISHAAGVIFRATPLI